MKEMINAVRQDIDMIKRDIRIISRQILKWVDSLDKREQFYIGGSIILMIMFVGLFVFLITL